MSGRPPSPGPPGDTESPAVSSSIRQSQVSQAPPTSSSMYNQSYTSQQNKSMRSAPAPKGVDPQTATLRFCVIVCGILVIICLGVVAIVLPLVTDLYCDCESSTRDSAQPTPAPGTPTLSPSFPPTSERFTQFVNGYAAEISGTEAFEDYSSPQFQAAEFIANEVSFDVSDLDQLGDLYALSVFYYSTNGDDWKECSQGDTICLAGQSWMNPELNHCQWAWISCNDDGRVVNVIFTDAEGNNLDGPLTLELGLLTELTQFVAVNNKITGNFPEEFGELTKVTHLILASNSMSGVIADDFLINSPVEIFMVNNNEFSGAIPRSLTEISTLSQLLLANNRFNGAIPEEFGRLTNLGTLDLTGNQFIGVIPDAIYSDSIENLFLGENPQLQGTISSAIGQANNLSRLRITNTGISGSIPNEIYSLPRLAELDLSDNSLTGQLSGSVSNLGDTLRILKLEGNNFNGVLPSSAIDQLIVSNVLKFERNSFTGTISANTCARRGDGRNELDQLTVDCEEVTCNCCDNCT
mmetsp:Transcript_27345/g.48559  ORF Transcript_27345/g.48559 Transcript_27345/m.48559 type:complete len:523 (+) Transcript_27345:129-1697(+)